MPNLKRYYSIFEVERKNNNEWCLNFITLFHYFSFVTIKRNREMQSKDGTTMESAEMKKIRKYGRDQIKLSKDQIFQSYFILLQGVYMRPWTTRTSSLGAGGQTAWAPRQSRGGARSGLGAKAMWFWAHDTSWP